MESSLASLALQPKNNPVGFLKVDGARVLEGFGYHKAEVARVSELIIEIGGTAINVNDFFGVYNFFLRAIYISKHECPHAVSAVAMNAEPPAIAPTARGLDDVSWKLGSVGGPPVQRGIRAADLF